MIVEDNIMNKKRNRIYVTAYDLDRGAIRLALNPETAIEINDRHWSTGVRMDRCWFGRHRIIAQSYSIWDDGHGRCYGTSYSVISGACEILSFCDKAGIESPDWVAVEEI